MLPITPRGSVLIAVSVLTSVSVVLFLNLRMVRNVKFKKFGWDEVLIILAAVIQLATAGLSIASVINGNGRHIYELPDLGENFRAIALPWVSQPLFAAALLVSKSSLAVTLLNLGLGKKFNYIVIASVVSIAVVDLWAIIHIVASCNPRSNPDGGPCRSSTYSTAISYFYCSVNIVVDVIFFGAPEYFLRKTKLSSRDRLAIRCLLGFVFAATIMSIVKIVYLRVLLVEGDITWNSPAVSDASLAESGLSIIAACLPAVRQLAGQKFPRHWTFWNPHSEYTKTSRSGGAATPAARHRVDYANNIENGKSSAKVRIINDLAFSEEDRDVVKLIPYSTGSDRTNLVDESLEEAILMSAKSAAITSIPLPTQSTSNLALKTPQSDRADGIEGRSCSRIKVQALQETAINLSMYDRTSLSTDKRQTVVDSNSLTDSSSNIDLCSSLSSRTSSRYGQPPGPITPQCSSTPCLALPSPTFLRPSADARSNSDRIANHNHSYTGSFGSVMAFDLRDPLPMAPFYFENNKVRRSARPSLDQPAFSRDHTRTSTLDSTSGLNIKMFSVSWLRENNSDVVNPN